MSTQAKPAAGSEFPPIASTDLKPAPLPPALVSACRNFEDAAGGREALVEHLSHASLDMRQQLLVGAIADPRNDQESLARICQLYGLQFSTLLGLFREAGFARAQVEAMRTVWEKTPALADDIMTRALPHQVACGACGGYGTVRVKDVLPPEKDEPKGAPVRFAWREEECEACRGTKLMTRQPTLDQQKLAAEMSGLISKSGGAQVAVQVNAKGAGASTFVVGGAGVDVLQRFAAAADQVMYGGKGGPGQEAVDAEVLAPGREGEQPAGAPDGSEPADEPAAERNPDDDLPDFSDDDADSPRYRA